MNKIRDLNDAFFNKYSGMNNREKAEMIGCNARTLSGLKGSDRYCAALVNWVVGNNVEDFIELATGAIEEKRKDDDNLSKKRTLAHIKKTAVPDVWIMPWKPTGRPWSEGKPIWDVGK